MPVYEYWCDTHGVFEAMGSMDAYKDPVACPTCGDTAPRMFLTVPGLGASDRTSIRPHDVDARSSDCPKRSSQHGPGCACFT